MSQPKKFLDATDAAHLRCLHECAFRLIGYAVRTSAVRCFRSITCGNRVKDLTEDARSDRRIYIELHDNDISDRVSRSEGSTTYSSSSCTYHKRDSASASSSVLGPLKAGRLWALVHLLRLRTWWWLGDKFEGWWEFITDATDIPATLVVGLGPRYGRQFWRANLKKSLKMVV